MFPHIVSASIINEETSSEGIKTYYVSTEEEKLIVLNLIKAKTYTTVNIVYSGDVVPISKKDLKFYYMVDTLNNNYLFQDYVLSFSYSTNLSKGFSINNLKYNKKDNTIFVTYKFSYYDNLEQSEYTNDVINKAIRNNISNLQTDYQKAHWAYKWVIDNIHYDNTLTNFSPYGGLTEKGTVCSGYAALYSIIANKLGLDCKYIEGSVYSSKGNNHAWNIIKLDGKWYCIDTTWGDKVGEDEYFLKSIYTLALDEYGNHESNVYDKYISSGEKFAEDDYTKICDTAISPISPSVYNVEIDVLKINILDVGEVYNFLIDNPENVKLEFKSTDSNVADIDLNGNITGYEKGTTIITVFNEDLNISQSCKIIIK